MAVIKSQLKPRSAEFRANAERMRGAGRGPARRRSRRSPQGGDEAARDKHIARGKLLPRERVAHAARPGLAVPRDRPARRLRHVRRRRAIGVDHRGIGRVSGRECVIVANDATVKGGTYYPMTVKKHLRAQEIARRTACRASTWSIPAARFLPEQDEVFPDREHFGRIFYNQANMSAAGIPQIACVMGSCTAGGAYVPAMSRRVDHRQEPGHDLPRRPAAGEGGDRRGRHAPRSWAAPTCTRASPASPTTTR